MATTQPSAAPVQSSTTAAPAAPTTVPAVQTPTVGRRVWYRPVDDLSLAQLDDRQALDAGVLFVTDDRTVNLLVTDHLGQTAFRRNVRLLQSDDQPPVDESYAEWMPYQKAAAAGAK